MSGIVKCKNCNKNIQGNIVSAMGNTYHPNHFLCVKCEEPIGGQKFYSKNGAPYCEEDFVKEFLTKCYECQEQIDKRILKAMGRNYHEEHFICIKCRRQLASLSYIIKDGEPICQECYNNYHTDKCKGCRKPIVDKIILALNEKWHRGCFKCCKCNKPVIEDTFAVEGDAPLCSRCS